MQDSYVSAMRARYVDAGKAGTNVRSMTEGVGISGTS